MANCWLNFRLAAIKKQPGGEPLFTIAEVEAFAAAIEKDGKDAAIQKMLDEDNYTLKQINDAVIAKIPELAAADKEAKAETILDAAGVTGKERSGALKDVRDGMTLGALERAYPAKVEDGVVPEAKEPAQAAKAETDSTAPIADFGEKIAGAKKEYAAAYKDRMSAAKDMDILAEPLSKSWPEPDYQKLVDAGADPLVVGLVRSMRDEIPSKPGKSYKQKTWVSRVSSLRDTADQMLNDKEFADKFVSEMKRMEHIKLDDAINGRAELYALLGHEKSLKGIQISRSQYGVYNGQPFNPPKIVWEVTRAAKATAFGNMPTTLGSGETRQDAIDAFVKAYANIDSAPKDNKTKFELYADRYAKAGDKGQYFIGKKVGRNVIRIKEGIDTVKEARAYIVEHNDELTAILEAKKAVPKERYDVNQPRVGQDMRNGQDVSPEMFADAFKLRGVQFGNYVEGKRRQQDLNDAYDALMDLAAVLDIPPKALSLNGELGLAFGARGSGGVNPASAHYEPGQVVINLTKGSGAGSLAHEWFHALDNYFSRMRGEGDKFITDSRDVNSNAGYPLDKQGVRREMIDAFGAVKKAVNSTAMKARSGSLDSRRSKEYWGTGIEMAARAFERYVIAKLHDSGFANDYLANVVSEEYWNAADALGIGEGGSYPYPTESELPAIRAGFDQFFQTIDTKETDKGTALFSRTSTTTTNQTPATIAQALRTDPNTKKYADILLKRGDEGKRGGVVIGKDTADTQRLFDERESDTAINLTDESGNVQGMYSQSSGTAYLIADRLTPETAPGVLLHEVGVHATHLGKSDPEFQKILKKIEVLSKFDPKVKAARQRALDALPADATNELINEETAAYLVELNPDLSISKQIIAWFRNALRAIGKTFDPMERMKWNKWANDLTSEDIVFMARSGMAQAARGDVRTGEGVVSRSDQAERFYSQLKRTVRDAKDNGQFSSAAAFNMWASSKLSKVEREELFWTGLTDWMTAQGKTTKAAVLSFLDGGGVRVETKVLGDWKQINKRVEARAQEIFDAEVSRIMDDYQDQNGEELDSSDAHNAASWPDAEKQAQEELGIDEETGDTKHGGGNLVLPGGENYREIIILVPQAASWGASDTTHFGDTPDSAGETGKTAAWLRVNDRTSADGDAVLFIEEEQSKRGQAGRSSGFDGGDTVQKAVVEETSDGFIVRAENGDAVLVTSNRQRAEERATEMNTRGGINNVGVKPAPFVSDSNNKATNAHITLALKHAIIDAVERGKTVIAWTTGKQQADRYSLSKQVDEVTYNSQTYQLTATDKNGAEVIRKEGVRPDDLAEHIGKGAAEKIMQQEPYGSGKRTLKGVELDVGGEWAHSMYGDENGLDASGKPSLMTQAVNSIFKQLKIEGKVDSVDLGEKVTAEQFPHGWVMMNDRGQQVAGPESSRAKAEALYQAEGKGRQPGFRITPELRAKVLGEGIPLFSKNPFDGKEVATTPVDKTGAFGRDTGNINFSKSGTNPTIAAVKDVIDKIPNVSEAIKGERFTLPGESQAQRGQRKSQDAQNRWKVIQDAVVEQGGTITEATNVYEGMTKYPGRVAAAMLDFGNEKQEPILQHIAAANTTSDEVAMLAYAEHAPERNKAIAEINPLFQNDGTPGKSGSGMTDQDAKDIVAHFKAQPNAKEMFALTAELRALSNERLDKLVSTNSMTQAQADAYRAKYKFYVPLKGFELVDEAGVPQGTGKGFSTGKKIDMRATGRSSRAGQVMENVFRDYEAALVLMEKKKLGEITEAFFKANPDSKLWGVGEAPKKASYTKGGSVHQVLYVGSVVGEFTTREGAEQHAEMLRQAPGRTASEVEVQTHKLHPEGLVIAREAVFDPEEEIRFIRDGKEMRVQITDPLMVRAYNNLWHPGVSGALEVLNKYNSWLRQMYTQKNPAWFAMNILRDIPSAAIYSTGEYGGKVGARVIGNIPKAFKAAWNFHHKKSSGTEMDKTLKLFLANGGYTGFAYVGDIEAQALKLQGMIHRYTPWSETTKSFKAGEYKKGLHDVGVKLLNHRFIAWIEALNTTFENTTRLAVFMAALDSGQTPHQAGILAKTASTNFNRKGEWGATMNSVWLFSNAGIQGTRNVGHALFFSPHKEQVWALMGGLIAMGIMASMMSDDDDDLVDDSTRAKSIVFKIGDTRLAIPMPYGFGFFSGFGQLVAQTMKHPEKREKIAVMMADLTMSHFSPFGNPLAGGEAKIEGLANLTPTIGKPFAQTMVNVSSFGGMMYPESPYDTKPDSEKAWRGTKGTAYDMTAKWLNSLTGGDVAREGLVSVSPETLKLGVSTLFGGVGRLLTDTTSLMIDVPSGNDVKAKNIPVLKNFYQAVDVDSYMKRFYNDSSEAADAYKTYRAYKKAGDHEAAKEYLMEERIMVSMGKMVAGYNKKLADLREAEDDVKLSPLPKEIKKQKLEKIDARRKMIAKQFNDKLKRM